MGAAAAPAKSQPIARHSTCCGKSTRRCLNGGCVSVCGTKWRIWKFVRKTMAGQSSRSCVTGSCRARAAAGVVRIGVRNPPADHGRGISGELAKRLRGIENKNDASRRLFGSTDSDKGVGESHRRRSRDRTKRLLLEYRRRERAVGERNPGFGPAGFNSGNDLRRAYLDSQLVGNDDMGTLDVHRPTDSLTGYGISRLASAIVGETERVPWGKPWDRQPVSGKLRRKLGVSPGFAAYPPERLATPTSPTAAPTHPPPADFARNPSADPVAARSGRRRAPSPGNRGPLRTPRRCPPPPPPAPAAR